MPCTICWAWMSTVRPWLPQDPLRDGFDTDAQLLQVTPNFLDQSVAAARALALQAVGDPKAAPIDTTYGNIANMIISLNPRPGTGTGNQEKYQDGMPFGTRGGMVAEHWFAADGEYSLTIGDMAMAARSAEAGVREHGPRAAGW